MNSLVILVPIYKAELTPLERLSLDHALSVLRGEKILFLAPEGLPTGFYESRYEGEYIRMAPEHFQSVGAYSRLLLSEAFYERFLDYEFMLILQTDVFLFRNDLAAWISRPFDYVGAPWPDGFDLFVNCDQFVNPWGKRVYTRVGNGGLSLRRVRKCLALIREFPDASRVFLHQGSNEDLFFSIMGALSEDFVIPNEMTAARFCLEMRPDFYYGAGGQRLPMGAHAWWRTSPDFWIPHIRAQIGADALPTLQAAEAMLPAVRS